jgi:osmotically-inducible protein OsmY
MTFRVSTLAVWACFGLVATGVHAQSRATGSTGSTGGVTQVTPTQATSLSSGTSASTTGTGGSSAGGSGGTGGNVQMNTGNQPEFNTGDGSVGAQVGQNGFTGRSNTAFAGNRNATQGDVTSLLPQFNQMTNQGNQGNPGTTGRSNIKRARPQQKIAFSYPKANLATIQVEMSNRFQRMTSVSGASVSISDEGVVTLTGMVASDDSRKLAEALARLEPGVRSVVNELQVEQVSP